MIIKICNDVVSISDDEILNTKNYIDSLRYMKNLHVFIMLLNECVDIRKVKFLPSFRGKTAINQLGLNIKNTKEQHMEIFRVTSEMFFEDKQLIDKIKNYMKQKLCESVIYDSGIMTFSIDPNKIRKFKKK